MIQNYFKLALRNLLKNRMISVINIAGLSIGLTCFVFMAAHVWRELSFDRWHTRHERIYRLVSQDSERGIAKVPGQFGVFAKKNIPEVDEFVRFVRMNETLISRDNKRFYERRGMWTDSSVFKIFSFQLEKGDPEKALAQPQSVVLTKSFARKYFGDTDPVGQSLLFDNRESFLVTGLLDDVPENAHFQFDFLASMVSYKHPQRDQPMWFQYYTYLLLSPGASPETVGGKIKSVLEANYPPVTPGQELTPYLQRITDIHLKSHLHREMGANSNWTQVGIFSVIALFVLLVACINFVNLTTAFSVRRAKEVGIRKATGAGRLQLVRQFLGEGLLAAGFAVLLAAFLVQLLSPAFSELMGSATEMDWGKPAVWGFFIVLWLVTGLASGLYPAFVLSAFRPVAALKNLDAGKSAKGAFLRKGLVVFQFVLSVFLIVAALTIHRQYEFMRHKDLGFNEEQVVNFDIRSDAIRLKPDVFKRALLENPNVVSVSFSGNLPGGSDFGIPWQPEGIPPGEAPAARSLVVDCDFLKTYEMQIAQGRGFSAEFPTDTSSAFIINESAAKALGWQKPLEHRIAMPNIQRMSAPVIGVVRDFHFRSMHQEIGPLLFFVPPSSWFAVVSVRIRPENSAATLAFIEKTWNAFDAEHPFTYSFLDQDFAQLYAREARTVQLMSIVSCLAIFIACLGLFGLSAFAAQQRTKEIGIRKVMGASAAGITGLLAKDFLKLVVVAILIASPLAYFFMNKWLADFAYRIDIQWWVFVAAGLAAVAIAFLTVSFQSVKAALANPVKSLRSE